MLICLTMVAIVISDILMPIAATELNQSGKRNSALKQLTDSILSKHEKNAPPDSIIEVDYEIELVHIVGVDELKQRMTVVVYVVEEWDDISLAWNPDNFSGIMQTWLPFDQIWLPDIIVFNMLNYKKMIQGLREPVRVRYDGRVTHSYPALYSVMCIIAIPQFPFDEQHCALEANPTVLADLSCTSPDTILGLLGSYACFQIASWGYSVDKLVLNVTHAERTSHYSPNEEWSLKSVGIQRTRYEHDNTLISQLRLMVHVSRKPLFYMTSLVMPSYILCALSISGLFARFSTGHERQERYTLGITSILTMAVLSLVIAEKVPHSSQHIPLLLQYFLFNIVVVTVATVLTSPVMRVHGRGFASTARPPPPWLHRLLFLPIPSKEKYRAENRHRHSHRRSELIVMWSRLSRRMDYGLMALFLLVLTTPTVYLFVMCYLRLHEAAKENFKIVYY